MEEAPENGKELLHSAHANGMNELPADEDTHLDCIFFTAVRIHSCIHISVFFT
jgi:hypothetical protein